MPTSYRVALFVWCIFFKYLVYTYLPLLSVVPHVYFFQIWYDMILMVLIMLHNMKITEFLANLDDILKRKIEWIFTDFLSIMIESND